MQKIFKVSYCKDYLDYICVDQTGKLFRPNFVTEHFAYMIKKFGLKKIRFHDLRHTCASLLLANGVPMKHRYRCGLVIPRSAQQRIFTLTLICRHKFRPVMWLECYLGKGKACQMLQHKAGYEWRRWWDSNPRAREG